jgi:16S rRNA processing protein RimM
VAQITGAFGIKGQLKVRPLTDFVERFDVGRVLRHGDQEFTVEAILWHGSQLILTLKQVKDRTTAERLQFAYLDAREEERPELDDDEYLTSDLIGLEVVTDAGEKLGTVKDVLSSPAHDLIVVGDLLIPAVQEFILDIDLDARTMTVHLIDGMRDL